MPRRKPTAEQPPSAGSPPSAGEGGELLRVVARFRNELESEIEKLGGNVLAELEKTNQAIGDLTDKVTALDGEVTLIRRQFGDAQQTARTTIDEVVELARQTRGDAEAAKQAAEVLSAVEAERPELLDKIASAHQVVGTLRDEMTALRQQQEHASRRIDKAIGSMGDLRATTLELRAGMTADAGLAAAHPNGKDLGDGQGNEGLRR